MEMIPSSKLNIAVENGLFTDDFLLYHLYPWWFWIAMSNYSRLNTPFIVVIVHLPVKASMCLHMPPFIDMWNKSYLISLAKSANSTDESMGKLQMNPDVDNSDCPVAWPLTHCFWWPARKYVEISSGDVFWKCRQNFWTCGIWNDCNLFMILFFIGCRHAHFRKTQDSIPLSIRMNWRMNWSFPVGISHLNIGREFSGEL
jgi:hypothetical protein